MKASLRLLLVIFMLIPFMLFSQKASFDKSSEKNLSSRQKLLGKAPVDLLKKANLSLNMPPKGQGGGFYDALNTTEAFGYMAADLTGASGVPVGPISFFLDDPGTFYSLLNNTTPNFMSSACWLPGGIIYATQYLGGLFEMDPETGYLTQVMSTPYFTGIAYDGEKLFGMSADGFQNILFEIDPVNLEVTEIGPSPTTGNLIISIDCDADGNMYGYDIGDDTFYEINKETGAATAIGAMGYDFAFAQDMAFDKTNDICYLAGFTGTTLGALYTVDVATGIATYIGNLDGQAEVSALAIPYESSYSDDLALHAILSPNSGTNLTSQDTVTIRILNRGNNAASDFEVSYSVNGGSEVTETFAGTLDGNSNAFYTFATTVDLSAFDSTYVITACVNLPGDEDPENDCLEKSVHHQTSIYPSPKNLTAEAVDDDVYLSWNKPFYGAGIEIFHDDFEDYQNGAYVAQSNENWTTWTQQPGSAEDAKISQDFSNSPVQSMKMVTSNDMVYQAGNYTEGVHDIHKNIYFPQNYSGWLILLQHFEVNNYQWGGQIYFGTDGSGYIDGGAASAASFTFNYNEWIEVRNFINLEDDYAEFWINDDLIHTWQWSTGAFGGSSLNEFGAIDFFQPESTIFYVDDFNHTMALDAYLLGYNIYRDGEFINFTTDTSYVDKDLPNATYEYCVSAVYEYDESDPICVNVDVMVGVEENPSFTLNVYPVPAEEFINIESPFAIDNLMIYTLEGVKIQSAERINSKFHGVSVRSLPAGVYIMHIRTVNNKVFIRKIVVARN